MVIVSQVYSKMESCRPHRASPVGHIAENCSSDQRLCYNCRQPGHESSACPSPRTVAAKQVRASDDSMIGPIHLTLCSVTLAAVWAISRPNVPVFELITQDATFVAITPSRFRPDSGLIELWCLRAHCSVVLLRFCWNEFCIPCSASWPRPECFHFASRKMLPLRRPKSYGKVRK